MKRVTVILLALALLALGNGAWIHMKAQLAQVLLRAAWERTLRGATNARPWPWADTRPAARLVIEKTGSDFIVLEGANGSALAFAPAHLEHTALPGQRGNAVISAHRDTHFTALRDLVAGDAIKVQRPDGRWLEYRVAGTRVVDERDTWITRSDDAARLTLVTCYPFDAIVPGGRERYVVESVTLGEVCRLRD